ncbi:hypothetical protein V5O48_007705, partial [Marasmius crinis-equi]
MSEIQSDSLQAVKSLRSRFEQLSVDPAPPKQIHNLSLEPPSSPRPRAQSSGNSPVLMVQPSPPALRNASSSSDLKGAKRPPPPPPPLNRSRAPSPSPSLASSKLNPSPPFTPPSANISPLLRPVPIPPGALHATPTTLYSPFGSAEELNNHAEGLPVSNSVSALRNKFITPASPSKTNGVHASNGHHAKPAVPPRKPSKNYSSESLLPGIPSAEDTPFIQHAHTKSSSTYSNSSSSSSVNLLDDSSSDETDLTVDEADLSSTTTSNITLPPALPARKPRMSDDALATPSTKSIPVSQRISPVPPPRPPRHRSTPDSLPEISTALLSPSPPPPLPARRGTYETSSVPPRHPSASSSVASLHHPPPSHHNRIYSTASISSITDTSILASPIATTPIASASTSALNGNTGERKAFGKLPPPPTRTIGLGDKLPPARRPPTPSSDEDEDSEDEDSPVHGYPGVAPGTDNRIHVPANSGHLVVTNGHAVVGHGHHLK